MKNKSWQRFSLSVMMVAGYFSIIYLAYKMGDMETVKVMVAALPPMIVAVTSVWMNQAGNEKGKEKNGSA
jgi:hypothetical protein